MQEASNKRVKKLVISAVFIAMTVVLGRVLSIRTSVVTIGFSFIPVVMASMILGPWYGMLVGILSDFIGSMLFPIGPYFIGFTISAGLVGLIYGLFLYKNQNVKRIIGGVVVSQILCSLLMNTFWISIVVGTSFWGLFTTRIVQSSILIIVEIVVIVGLIKLMPTLKKIIN